MGIGVHEFISLDGVFEDPRWTAEFGFDQQMGQAIGEIMQNSSGILLGRNTFEMFAPAWSGRTAAEDPGAPFMNNTPKYVVGATEPAVEWNNTARLGAYDADVIAELKRQAPGDLYVSGSGTLVRALLRDGLIDDLHLFVFPVVRGTGKLLFGDAPDPVNLGLAETASYPNGVVHLHYQPAAAATS